VDVLWVNLKIVAANVLHVLKVNIRQEHLACHVL